MSLFSCHRQFSTSPFSVVLFAFLSPYFHAFFLISHDMLIIFLYGLVALAPLPCLGSLYVPLLLFSSPSRHCSRREISVRSKYPPFNLQFSPSSPVYCRFIMHVEFSNCSVIVCTCCSCILLLIQSAVSYLISEVRFCFFLMSCLQNRFNNLFLSPHRCKYDSCCA